MKRLLIAAVLVFTAFAPMAYLAAHCEVPCGIYDDGARFAELKEDQATIAKAIGQITELAGTHDATGHNQLARWVATKEAHATNTQHVIAQYFMTQKIKPDAEHYVDKLTAAHGVLVAAMKCKQSADPAMAEALSAAITKFETAYVGHAH
ncbi:MAG: superoxide dismutase [Ni] [Planctomycetota bacterium]